MPVVDVAIGVVRDKIGNILIAKRKDDTHQGGLWEFPGGKFEAGEDAEQALTRELYEELGIKTRRSAPLININFQYPECNVQLHVREVHEFDGQPIGCEGQVWKWIAVQNIEKYAFPEANKAIISAIKLARHYAIIGGNNCLQVVHNLDSVATQGVRLVQIRIKSLNIAETAEILVAARDKCSELGISYLLNSRMPIARNVNEGVHLTSFDLMVLKQRPESSGFVAASCHNLQELYKAEQLALDFAVLSPVLQTASHPGATTLGWEQFAAWVAKVNIPVFALGGVAKQDYKKALEYGAQGISGISLYQ